MKPHIRWMIRRDMPEVYEIDHIVFQFPWTEDDFTRCLQQRNCIGMVAEVAQKVAGFMIYELHKDRLHVLNFAVHPSCWRRGIGRAMIDNLKSKLTLRSRCRIMLEVRETNLHAQCFFRSMGFRAVSLLRDFYTDTTDDAYLMSFRLQEGAVVS